MTSSTSKIDTVDVETNYHKVTNKIDDSFVGIKLGTIELIFIILKHIIFTSHPLKNQETMFLQFCKLLQLQKRTRILK